MAHSIQVVFACDGPNRLADFWAGALGYVVQPPPAGRLSEERERLEKLGVTYQREATGMAGEIWIEIPRETGFACNDY